MSRLTRTVPGALVALALLLGACGGDDESSPAVTGVDFPVDAPEPPAGEPESSEDDSGDGSGDSGSSTDAGGAATGG